MNGYKFMLPSMCLRGVQRDKLTLSLSTAEFSYYTCNIFVRQFGFCPQGEGGIGSQFQWRWLILPKEPIPLFLTFYPKTEIEADREIW